MPCSQWLASLGFRNLCAPVFFGKPALNHSHSSEKDTRQLILNQDQSSLGSFYYEILKMQKMSSELAEHLPCASPQCLLPFVLIYIAVSLLFWPTDIFLGSVFFSDWPTPFSSMPVVLSSVLALCLFPLPGQSVVLAAAQVQVL